MTRCQGNEEYRHEEIGIRENFRGEIVCRNNFLLHLEENIKIPEQGRVISQVVEMEPGPEEAVSVFRGRRLMSHV